MVLENNEILAIRRRNDAKFSKIFFFLILTPRSQWDKQVEKQILEKHEFCFQYSKSKLSLQSESL